LKIRLALISGLLASFLCVGALSQSYKPFPGDAVDQRTRDIQERVEELYTAGNFDRALWIYERDLAPLGDKYAQYMVGHMYMNAEGVPQNMVEALAWFRLSAERGEPLLVKIRDELVTKMSVAEIAASDPIFLGLWKTMGDRALIIELVQRDMNLLKAQTGTRIPGSATSTPGLIFKPSGVRLGPNFYADVRKRLDARIAYLEAKVEIIDIVLADEIEKARSLEAEFKADLAVMENR